VAAPVLTGHGGVEQRRGWPGVVPHGEGVGERHGRGPSMAVERQQPEAGGLERCVVRTCSRDAIRAGPRWLTGEPRLQRGAGWAGSWPPMRGSWPQYERWGQPRLNKSPKSIGSKQIQTIPNFGRSEKYLPLLGKNKIKYDFEDLKDVNNFLHRNFFIFGMDLELKFRKLSRLEFDIVSF
jgi:hypothetical protein